MPFEFPPAPLVGDDYTIGGIIYTWTGTNWDIKGGNDPQDFILRAGDTMTGPLGFGTDPFNVSANVNLDFNVPTGAAHKFYINAVGKFDVLDAQIAARTNVEVYSAYIAIRPATGFDGQNMIHFRDSAGSGPAWLRGQGSSYEGGMLVHTRNGGWGWTDSFRSNCSSAGELYVNSNATAQAYDVRSSRATKHDIRDCTDAEVTAAWNAMRPKRFRRNLPPPPIDDEGKPLANPWPYPAPRLQYGFILEELAKTAADDVVSMHYVPGTEGKTFVPGGVDIMQVLALTVAKVKQLEAEIATLKGAARS